MFEAAEDSPAMHYPMQRGYPDDIRSQDHSTAGFLSLGALPEWQRTQQLSNEDSDWVGLRPSSWLDDDEFGEDEVGDDSQFAAIQFAQWAGCRWDRLHDLFNMDSRLPSVTQRCEISETDFVEYLRRHGFHGDGPRIFRYILNGSKGDAFASDPGKRNGARTVRLPEFLRFQRYCSALAAPILDDELQSFVDLLRRQRGTVLRAWRMDLDHRGVGRVTFADLASACRKLNLSGEARSVWKALRISEKTTDSIKFAELDHQEAANLDRLVQLLWHKFGFDLNKTWSRIDIGRQGALSLEQFSRGLQSLGFNGNAKLIFRGLDVTGLGRLRRMDFDYLQVLILPSTEALNTIRDVDPRVRDFTSWVQEEIGGPETLLLRLGLLQQGRQQSRQTLPIKEVVMRLQVLGFAGDALHVAVCAARKTDGAQVSSDSLMFLLSRKRVSSPGRTSGAMASPASSVCSSTTRKSRKPQCEWDNRIHNSTGGDTRRPRDSRRYFSMPTRGVPPRVATSHLKVPDPPSTPSSPSASARALEVVSPRRSPRVSPRGSPSSAQWNSSLEDFAKFNEGNPRYLRSYFSECDSVMREQSEWSPLPSPRRTPADSQSGGQSPVGTRIRAPATAAEQKARVVAARRTVGPFARAGKRVTKHTGTRRRQPGDDSEAEPSEAEASSAEVDDWSFFSGGKPKPIEASTAEVAASTVEVPVSTVEVEASAVDDYDVDDEEPEDYEVESY
jgi:hypothetical protein